MIEDTIGTTGQFITDVTIWVGCLVFMMLPKSILPLWSKLIFILPAFLIITAGILSTLLGSAMETGQGLEAFFESFMDIDNEPIKNLGQHDH